MTSMHSIRSSFYYNEGYKAKENEMSTIKLGSVSYPYLAIAKHYNVPYRIVLAFLDDDCQFVVKPWQVAVLKAEAMELERRRRVK